MKCKIQCNNGKYKQYGLTLPKQIVDGYNLKTHQEVSFKIVSDNKLMLEFKPMLKQSNNLKCFICSQEIKEFDKKEKLKNGFYIHSDITIYNCFQESMKQNLLL